MVVFVLSDLEHGIVVELEDLRDTVRHVLEVSEGREAEPSLRVVRFVESGLLKLSTQFEL